MYTRAGHYPSSSNEWQSKTFELRVEIGTKFDESFLFVFFLYCVEISNQRVYTHSNEILLGKFLFSLSYVYQDSFTYILYCSCITALVRQGRLDIKGLWQFFFFFFKKKRNIQNLAPYGDMLFFILFLCFSPHKKKILEEFLCYPAACNISCVTQKCAVKSHVNIPF